jgi:hypothetical protein
MTKRLAPTVLIGQHFCAQILLVGKRAVHRPAALVTGQLRHGPVKARTVSCRGVQRIRPTERVTAKNMRGKAAGDGSPWPYESAAGKPPEGYEKAARVAQKR